MNRYVQILVAGIALCWSPLRAQDTFSIVALDTITGEVGSAGASCVDMFVVPYPTDFLGDLIPGVGVINTQAAYLAANQNNARTRMLAGDSPSQIISWLVAHDAQATPTVRQYGIAGFVNGLPEAAGYTGSGCMNYKNHITTSWYSIQGNILLGQLVLDSMEARFLNAQGDLACKLMAALQGAKMIGADTRCTSDSTSSLFAFVKVALPTDPYGSPSFLLSVRTHDNSSIEPIDTLQILFDAAHGCAPSGLPGGTTPGAIYRLSPNPSTDLVTVVFTQPTYKKVRCSVVDALGKSVMEKDVSSGFEINTHSWEKGVYFFEFRDDAGKHNIRFVKD